MNEKTVIKHSKYIFLVGLILSTIASIILKDSSIVIGLVVGYVISLLAFLLIIKTSETILHLTTSTVYLVVMMFLAKLVLYGMGFYLAIKSSWVHLVTVFLGYFIIKITIYVDTYLNKGGEVNG